MGRARRKYKKKAQFDWTSGATEINTLANTLSRIASDEKDIKLQRVVRVLLRVRAIIGYGHFNKLMKDD